jgi:hypothetical protein
MYLKVKYCEVIKEIIITSQKTREIYVNNQKKEVKKAKKNSPYCVCNAVEIW